MAARDERFWAKFLGIEASDLQVPGVCVRPHAGLAGYQGMWSVVHPRFRRRGHGTAVVSAVVESALAAGKTLLYQTLESNLSAVRDCDQAGGTNGLHSTWLFD